MVLLGRLQQQESDRGPPAPFARSRRGMLALLRNLFRAPAEPSSRASGQPEAHGHPTLAAAPDEQGPLAFARFAEAMRLPTPASTFVFSPRELERDEAAARQLLARVAKDQRGPDSFPALSLRVLQLIANGDPHAGELTQLISRDPALSASTLRVANSPLYRGFGASLTVREAIARLGTREAARVAGAVSARSLFDQGGPQGRSERPALHPSLAEQHQHSTAVAAGAAWLALQYPAANADHAWLGGLLHDIGKSLALRALGALAAEGKAPAPANDARTARLLHRVHGKIGADLARRWSLPAYLIEMCSSHHTLQILTKDQLELHLVRLVSALRLIRVSPDLHPHAAGEIPESAWALQLDPRTLRTHEESWLSLATKRRSTAH